VRPAADAVFNFRYDLLLLVIPPLWSLELLQNKPRRRSPRPTHLPDGWSACDL